LLTYSSFYLIKILFLFPSFLIRGIYKALSPFFISADYLAAEIKIIYCCIKIFPVLNASSTVHFSSVNSSLFNCK